ncbi:MAG TPA: hypothetical protein VF134_06570 [Candidatus Dormibacteraeota bacterium]
MTRRGWVSHVAAAALPFATGRALVWLGTELGAFVAQGGVVPHTQPSDFFHWDALRYQSIWTGGYTNLEKAAFFPLYPYLVRWVGQVTGDQVAALLIPNVAFALALVIFHAEVQSHTDGRRANLATWALAIWPWSVFFSYPYTEALFLLLVVGSFRLMAVGRWALAGLVAALAAATRFPGVLMVAAFGAEAAQFGRIWGRRKVTGPVLAAVLTPLGLVAFALLLWRAIGDPLGFWHGQQLWVYYHRSPLFPIGEVVLMFEQQNPFKTESLGLPVLLMFVAGAVWTLRNLPWRYGVFTAVTVLLFAYQGWHLGEYHSVPRYLLADFACFFAFGAFLARYDKLQVPWFAISASLLVVEAALYGANHFIG